MSFIDKIKAYIHFVQILSLLIFSKIPKKIMENAGKNEKFPNDAAWNYGELETK